MLCRVQARAWSTLQDWDLTAELDAFSSSSSTRSLTFLKNSTIINSVNTKITQYLFVVFTYHVLPSNSMQTVTSFSKLEKAVPLWNLHFIYLKLSLRSTVFSGFPLKLRNYGKFIGFTCGFFFFFNFQRETKSQTEAVSLAC